MSDRFSAAVGRKVVSRASADEFGNIAHLVVDARSRHVSALVVGKRRKARLVDWGRLTGMGPDAAIVDGDDALREPADEREHVASEGKLEMLGKLALLETGNELGKIDDVVFDPESGQLLTIVVGSREHQASLLLGAGSYAIVLSDDESSSPSQA